MERTTRGALLGAGALVLASLALPLLGMALWGSGMMGGTSGAASMMPGGMMGAAPAAGWGMGWAWWALLPAALLLGAAGLLGWAALSTTLGER